MQRQVVNAIAAFATLPGVAVDPTSDQKRRIERLRALLEQSDFGGVQTRLGALIGLKSGAFIRQMLEGDRTIAADPYLILPSLSATEARTARAFLLPRTRGVP